MDSASANAEKMAKTHLPDHPHILTLTLDRTFPNPKGFWFTGASAPIQYMTYLSAGQRGILHTRASYDMIQDTEIKRAPLTVQDLAKDTTTRKKKMSAKDYLSRKRSPSPTAANRVPIKSEPKGANGVEVKRERSGTQTSDRSRLDLKEKERFAEAPRAERSRQDHDGDRTKTTSSKADVNAPLSNHKRRVTEDSEPTPPPKRPRADSGAIKDSIRAARLDTPRTREPLPEKPSRDTKSDKLYPTANGRPSRDTERDREYTASPKSTIQVNGHKTQASTLRKTEATKVPALLSPLHPSLGLELDDHERTRKRPAEKGPLKKIDVAVTKKPKLKMPELLSPTLPAVVEKELARLKSTSSQSDSSGRNSEVHESSRQVKKTRPSEREMEREREKEKEKEDEHPARPTKIVTLRLRKPAAKRAKDLLSLPSRSLKEAMRKERSMSVDETPPPGARKRPRMADEALAEAPGAKRNRTASEAVKTVAAPNTPLKHASTAMSRVTSSQSQIATPSNTHGHTPSTIERPPTSSEHYHGDPAKFRAKVESLRDRHEDFRALGGKLKHARDDLVRDRGNNLSSAEQRRVAALHFEMILAYMVSFNAFNQSRAMERKVCDLGFWESLLPHIRELKLRVKGNAVLLALAHQMHAVCLEEVTHAYATLDPASAAGALQKWCQLERTRAPTWEEAMRRCEDIDAFSMKAVIGPWTNADDAVASALSIMCKWAQGDRVDWRPSSRMGQLMNLPASSGLSRSVPAKRRPAARGDSETR